MKRIACITAATALLAAPATAMGHVTMQPEEAPAGGLRAPRRQRAPTSATTPATTKVEVEIPPGFTFASYEPVPGWDVAIKKRPATEPIEVFGETDQRGDQHDHLDRQRA